MKPFVGFLIVLPGLAIDAVRATPLSVINSTRATVCLHSTSSPPLSESPALDAAAARLARGASLHEALSKLASRPAFAAAIRLPDAGDDAQIRQAASRRFCKDLSAQGLREIGLARSGDSLWVIVTQPVSSGDDESRRRAESEVLTAVNHARAHARRCGTTNFAPATPVALSSALSQVALEHSEEMAADEALVHWGRDGSLPATRVRRANIAARHVGENIAAGVPTAEEVIAGWLASPSHCSVIMDPRFTAMGVSYAIKPHSRGVIFWTQLFAEPR